MVRKKDAQEAIGRGERERSGRRWRGGGDREGGGKDLAEDGEGEAIGRGEREGSCCGGNVTSLMNEEEDEETF